MREKWPNNLHPHLLQVQRPFPKLAGYPALEVYPAASHHPTPNPPPQPPPPHPQSSRQQEVFDDNCGIFFVFLIETYVVTHYQLLKPWVGGFNDPLRWYFSLYWVISHIKGERREMINDTKNVQTTPTHTYSKLAGRPSTKSLPSTIAPPDHPGAGGGGALS